MASRRANNLWTRYRITLEDYDMMLEDQNYQCAVCSDPAKVGKHLCVDHCHVTDKVRGLLCHSCNLALGKLSDTPEIAQRAADYLLHHSDR